MAFELDFRAFPDPGGPISSAIVPWDSGTFGFPVHELRITDVRPGAAAAVEDWLAQLPSGTDRLVCSRVDQEDVPLMEILAWNRFYPVETLLTVEARCGSVDPYADAPEPHARLRPATPEDLPAILGIARSAFWSDRFHMDPNLPDDAADRRYADWVQRASDSGEPLFAYETHDTGAVAGFCHLRPIDPETIDVMLVAIEPALRGLGMGRHLYHLVMQECVRMGFPVAQSRVSARNFASLNTFAQLGFRVTDAKTVLHRFQPADTAGSASET